MDDDPRERNIAAIRAFYAAGPALDDSGRVPFAAPDIVWHVPGTNHVSGDYRGHLEVFTTMGERMQPLDVWELDVVHVAANLDLVMASVLLRAARGEHRVECGGGHVFRFDAEGRVTEAWGFVEDQAGLDALLDS